MEFIDRLKFKQEVGIYKITNLVNNKVYIGQTIENFQKRYWHHVWKLNKQIHDNKYLQNSWNKYGEDNFEFSVVEIVSKEEIDSREKYWIQFYRNQNKCYNIQDGGQDVRLVDYCTSEARKKVGEQNRRRMLGSKLPESTKRKMSESRKGRHVSRSTDVLNDELAFKIKTMLVQGKCTGDICKELNVPYKLVNSILSCNTWSHVFVEGWDEFQKNRPRGRNCPVNGGNAHSRPKTPEEIKQIRKLYKELGTYNAVATAMGIDGATVKKYVLQSK